MTIVRVVFAKTSPNPLHSPPVSRSWLGITNFDLARTRELVEAGVDVACTQVQLSMLDQRPRTSGLLDYAHR